MVPIKPIIPQKSIVEKQKAQITLNFEVIKKNLNVNKLQLTLDKTAKEIQSVIERLWLS